MTVSIDHTVRDSPEGVSQSEDPDKPIKQPEGITIRPLMPSDGGRLFRAVGEAGTLEQNSVYTYCLFGAHFTQTSLIAEAEEKIVGFVIAYIPPTDPSAVFVWQIGVLPHARGRGLGVQLLKALVSQPACDTTSFVTATVAPSNQASDRLFRSFARHQKSSLAIEPFFTPEDFHPESHEQEQLYRIGPHKK